MEFRLAADGNTDELRQWLREHPERVNVPAQGSNMTLLYTTISNANRTDLASLQAGYSRYLNTVRMLCEEYKADVLAPNGGNHNTALHLAASIGAVDIVRYLVETLHTPVDRTNVFGERAAQMAERGGFSECVRILQRAASPRENSSINDSVSTPLRNGSTGPMGSGSFSHGGSVKVTDSDDEVHADRNHCSWQDCGTSAPGSGPQRPFSNTSMPSPKPLIPKSQYADTQMAPGMLPPTQLPSRTGNTIMSNGGENSNEGRMPRAGPQYGLHGSPRGGGGIQVGGEPIQATALELLCPTALPQPVRPRKEYDISKFRVLPNPDLQGFRSAYGDGFQYIQCSDHYEIRGILPYTYRGTVYYTPVIISVYAPAPANDSISTPSTVSAADARERQGSLPDASSSLGTEAPLKSGLPSDSPGVPVEVYCRYRVCLNLQSLSDFAVSRKAEYIDPISGAIIPAPGDDKYQTLTAYVRNVVVRNFEAVPPLIIPSSSYAFPLRPNVSQLGAPDNADRYRHHHSHNAPSFMKNVLPARTAAHIRYATILRDLSRFGDGLGRYFPSNHRIVLYVPLFSERKAAVLAMPQERPYSTTVDQHWVPASPDFGEYECSPSPNSSRSRSAEANNHRNKSNGADAKKAVTQQVAVEATAELQVRVWIQFNSITNASAPKPANAIDGREGGVYAYPPRFYLVDAALNSPAELTGSTTPAPNSLTALCFASLLRDRDTGEVDPEVLKLSQESWSTDGSLYNILVELQRVLRDAIEAFAVRYTGRHPASTPVQQAAATVNSYGHGYSSGNPTNADHSLAVPALDTFFASPTAPSQPSMSPHRGNNNTSTGVVPGAQLDTNSAGHCLYCYQRLQTRTLLQPCGHEGMCGLCVQRLQSHCREEVIACPVCRSAVRNVMEVFL